MKAFVQLHQWVHALDTPDPTLDTPDPKMVLIKQFIFILALDFLVKEPLFVLYKPAASDKKIL